MRRLPLVLSSAALALAALAAPRVAGAFCGFYVSGAGERLLNEATVVALVRDGTRTALSMQNHYRGPPEGFALVVPVPVVLKPEDVRTLPRDVFDHLDQLTAPRLVEYWEQDPCPSPGQAEGVLRPGAAGGLSLGLGSAGAMVAEVKVEARFAVGEYEIVVLSAGDSLALTDWLLGHGYRIPDGAAAVLRPYVEGGMKFFVARVDPAKVAFVDGAASLSPLRVQYEADTFTLPIRLGLLSSPGKQDLVVHVIAPDQRYEVANRPNLTIPTNVEVAGEVRDRFGAFYAALFDRAVAGAPGAAVTEYAWSTRGCDPCPVPPLADVDLATLGAEPRRPMTDPSRVPTGAVHFGGAAVSGGTVANAAAVVAGMAAGFRRCYTKGLREDANMKGSIRVSAKIGPNGEVLSVIPEATGLSGTVVSCVAARVSSAQFAPPEGGGATVVIPATFDSQAATQLATGPAQPALVYSAPRSFVMSRLHLRYDRDTLGEDLVFKAAPPILGGGEDRAGEQDAVEARWSRFQARYVIRHRWEGPVACSAPRRGVWGPAPATSESVAPRLAQALAFAPRGGVDLASLVRADVPALSLQARAVPAGDAGPAPAEGDRPPSRGCGACAAAPRAGGGEGALALALTVLVARRRRTRRSPGDSSGSGRTNP